MENWLKTGYVVVGGNCSTFPRDFYFELFHEKYDILKLAYQDINKKIVLNDIFKQITKKRTKTKFEKIFRLIYVLFTWHKTHK